MFATQPDISVDSIRGLIKYMKAGRRKPEEIRDFMAEAYAFVKACQEQCNLADVRKALCA